MSDYAQHSITITLNFDTVNLPDDLDMADVAQILTYSRWEEGRYPFDEEMVHVGLSRLLEYAIREAVFRKIHEQCPNETVEQDGSTILKASVLTNEAMKGFYTRTLDSIKAAEIGKPVKG
jgi:hypothetical protein